ncbi:uncharacterized protein LOC105771719 [Gossypium raimondii]|uniref:uncharacterized protein LOC105771719 n=1 Tax=Gossypium raimondii TaxID=29730 RepID=UPI00063ABA3A|nr:uncharacterized protein LOC105771719 [Gossypium raimondii]
MDIKPSFNYLLGRPWIHSAGAVPSSLHQKLKLVTEGQLVTISAEEDIIASVTSDAPYLGSDDKAIKCSFQSLEFVNATFVVEGNKIPMPSISRATRMGLQMTVGKGAMPRRGLGRCLQGRIEIEVYVDDMIAKSQTERKHVQVLRKLFLRLRKFQLKLNLAKCIFGARSGKLLGFVVSEKGIEIDPDKVRAIRDLPPPRTQKEVRECQEAFDKIKQYLSNTPVLSPPRPDKPLIMYLTVFDNSMGYVLGQHDETVKKEKAIYYLSKKFTDCEMRWQILLSKFDIVYVNQKAIKGSAIAEFFASRGNGIGAVLVSLNGDHYPFTSKLDFDCTNNMVEYEACIMGIGAAIERKIKILEVHGDSALVIYQLKGEWEMRDPKLVRYRKLVLKLIEEFDSVTFSYLPRDKNQMANALATLMSMIKVNKPEDVKPIQISIHETSAPCYSIEEEENNEHPWYQDILRYVKNREYPDHATENDKRTLRRLAIYYVLDVEILYKKGKYQVLLRCVDAVEAKKTLEEVMKVSVERMLMAEQWPNRL